MGSAWSQNNARMLKAISATPAAKRQYFLLLAKQHFYPAAELTAQDMQLLPAPLPLDEMFNDIYSCRGDCIVDAELILSDSWSEKYPAGATGVRVPYAEVFRRTYRISASEAVGLSREQARPIVDSGVQVHDEVDVSRERMLHGLVNILNHRATNAIIHALDGGWNNDGVRDMIRFLAYDIRDRECFGDLRYVCLRRNRSDLAHCGGIEGNPNPARSPVPSGELNFL